MEDHKDIHAAIAAVRAELCKVGIAKNQRNEMQKFKYRGIDDAYAVASPILAKHGVNPIVESVDGVTWSVRPTAKGTNYHMSAMATVAWIHVTGTRTSSVVMAEAFDSGDKVSSKFMSMVMKYAILTTFTVPVDGMPDGDAESMEPAELDRGKADAMPMKESAKEGEKLVDSLTYELPWPDSIERPTMKPDEPGFARAMLQALQDAVTDDEVLAVAERIPHDMVRSMKGAVREARARVQK
jgi:hypothetical protein